MRLEIRPFSMGFDIGSLDFLAKKPLEDVFSYAAAQRKSVHLYVAP